MPEGCNADEGRQRVATPTKVDSIEKTSHLGESMIWTLPRLVRTLNPRKCIGEKVRRIPINVETKWLRELQEEDEGNKFLEPTIFSPLKITPEKIAITAPKERTK